MLSDELAQREFCPVPDSVRSLYCKLVEGQLVSVDKPCPHRNDCCQLIEDIATVHAFTALNSQI